MSTLLEWFKIQTAFDLWLLVFGVMGQSVFFMRWVVQWVATERRGESHVPEMFWWFSLIGAMMTLAYFIMKHDAVGMLGQGVGWMVYCRNLYLIRARRRRFAAEAARSDYRPAGTTGRGAAKSAPDRSDRPV